MACPFSNAAYRRMVAGLLYSWPPRSILLALENKSITERRRIANFNMPHHLEFADKWRRWRSARRKHMDRARRYNTRASAAYDRAWFEYKCWHSRRPFRLWIFVEKPPPLILPLLPLPASLLPPQTDPIVLWPPPRPQLSSPPSPPPLPPPPTWQPKRVCVDQPADPSLRMVGGGGKGSGRQKGDSKVWQLHAGEFQLRGTVAIESSPSLPPEKKRRIVTTTVN